MTARQKSTREPAARRSSRRPSTASEALSQLERQLPKNLRGLVRDLRKNLGDLQKQVDKARTDRDERWRKIESQVRRDTVRLLRRIEKAVAPAAVGKQSKKSAKRKATRKAARHRKRRRKDHLPDHQKREPSAPTLSAVSRPKVVIGPAGLRHCRPQFRPDQPVAEGQQRSQGQAKQRLRAAHGPQHERDGDERADADHVGDCERGSLGQTQVPAQA